MARMPDGYRHARCPSQPQRVFTTAEAAQNALGSCPSHRSEYTAISTPPPHQPSRSAIAQSAPVSSLRPMLSARYSQLPSSTITVFACPVTWNVTALNRPRHMNWLTFTSTAMAHEEARQPSAGTLTSNAATHLPETSRSTNGPDE